MATPRIDLDGAVVLVTGAGGGIGAATALAFAERCSNVLAVDIDEVSAKQTAEACRATGSRTALARGCDVADAKAGPHVRSGLVELNTAHRAVRNERIATERLQHHSLVWPVHGEPRDRPVIERDQW
jgi:NAD(P)-dependent dehydrogenase (short-subunit alcohol dehydrogenase family)